MAKIPDNWLEILFEHGIDLPNRRVFLGEITPESALAVTKGMYALETQSDVEPIDLFISSPGGDVEATLGIFDIINTIRCPVHTFASGICMSAAPLLLAAGEPGNRWVTPNLRLMTHGVQAEISGRGRQLPEELKYIIRIDETWNELFAACTTKPVNFWRNLAAKPYDYHFTADQAVEWGVADSIWMEKQKDE